MIRRLNHAVLWVRDVEVSSAFYRDVLGFEVAGAIGDQAVFLRAGGSSNDHDLALFGVGEQRQVVAPRTPGLYHLAWQVETIETLAAVRGRLLQARALSGESDHGVSKSLYGRDPDGIEFEIMWAVPRHAWPDAVFTRRLDLGAELSRWAGVDTGDEPPRPAGTVPQ
jgi:catechol-2,3-dioxygenase